MKQVSGVLFTHKCACCEQDFRSPDSREDKIAAYKKKHPGAPFEALKILCPDCYDHVKHFPQVPRGHFIFQCAGCGMSHMTKPGGPVDNYPVLYIPLKEENERLCEACYEKALGALN